MLFEILSACREWLARTGLRAEVLTDRADALRVVFETENALAELIVAEPDCAPFRYVSFLIQDIRQGPNAAPAFCYYDDESSTIDDILRELDRGVRFLGAM